MSRGGSGRCHMTNVLTGFQMLKRHWKVRLLCPHPPATGLKTIASNRLHVLNVKVPCISILFRSMFPVSDFALLLFVFFFSLSSCFAEDCFDETVEAMLHLGINAEMQGHIFRVE